MNFKNIRTRIGEYVLKRKVGTSYMMSLQRKRTIMNIDSAKSFGIVYSADKEENIELVRKYSDMLRTANKKVTTLGFMNIKELPTGFNGSMQHQFFSRKEINWYFKPDSPFIDTFVKQEFDILLDFNIVWQIPLIFVSSRSTAKCKAGRYSEKYANLYDVMIETTENKKLEYFAENLYSYLQKLNKRI